MIDPNQQYGLAVDVWSFGVMARECWEKEPPYMDESQTKALFLIMSKGLPPLDYKRPGMDAALVELVNACWYIAVGVDVLAFGFVSFRFSFRFVFRFVYFSFFLFLFLSFFFFFFFFF